MSKVIELNKFKEKQQERRQPEQDNFVDRMARIRASLDRINTLMAELKKLSSDEKPTRRSSDK